MNTLTAISLVLDILGVILIFIASDKLSNLLAEFTHAIAETVGFWRDNPFTPEQFSKFQNTRKLASKLNIWGLTLLVAGFSGQLIAVILKMMSPV